MKASIYLALDSKKLPATNNELRCNMYGLKVFAKIKHLGKRINTNAIGILKTQAFSAYQ